MKIAFSLILSITAFSAHAAVLNSGALLTVMSGVQLTDSNGNSAGVSSGSYFGVDLDNNFVIAATEKTAILPGLDGGLIIGATQGPAATNTNALIDRWRLIPIRGLTTIYASTLVAVPGSR